MAIAFDAYSSDGTVTGASSVSWSHTCTGSDLAIAIGTASTDLGAQDANAASYNSVAATEANDIDNGTLYSSGWYLLDPATGANTVSVTYSEVQDKIQSQAVSFTGVDGFDASNEASGSSTTPSVSVTTVADNSWVWDYVGLNGDDDMDAGANQTKAGDIQDAAFPPQSAATSYEGPKTPAGSVTMSWTSTNVAWGIVAISFSPVVEGGGDPEGSLLRGKLLRRGLLGGVLVH